MDANKDAPLVLAGQLLELIRPHAKPEAGSWLQAQLAKGSAPGAGANEELRLAFASAGRKLGTAPLPAEEAAKLGLPIAPQIANRGLDEVARIALALTVREPEPPPPEAELFVAELYLRGDQREKQAVLRALALLPNPSRFTALGVEAVRSSVGTVFEAIACENSFPAAFFSDAQLNQLVLKALFNEVPIARILGLAPRVQPELVRMAQGYAAERRAAGRSVPADIDLIAAMNGKRSA